MERHLHSASFPFAWQEFQEGRHSAVQCSILLSIYTIVCPIIVYESILHQYLLSLYISNINHYHLTLLILISYHLLSHNKCNSLNVIYNTQSYHSIHTASFINPTFIEFYRKVFEYNNSQNLIFYHHSTFKFVMACEYEIFGKFP